MLDCAACAGGLAFCAGAVIGSAKSADAKAASVVVVVLNGWFAWRCWTWI